VLVFVAYAWGILCPELACVQNCRSPPEAIVSCPCCVVYPSECHAAGGTDAVIVDIDTSGIFVVDKNTILFAAMVLEHPAFQGIIHELPQDLATWTLLTKHVCLDGMQPPFTRSAK
jgi:hypothetical protein